MDLGLKGKRSLVTGASAGLGEAAATALAAEGVELVINSRSEQRLKAAADRIRKATGVTPIIAVGDLSIPSERNAVIKAAGDIDILVSNTGGPPPGAFLDHDPVRFEEAGRLLLDSAVNLTRAFLPGMMNRRWGRLIYITSVAVLQPVDTLILSNTYRAGVTGFCKTISNTYGHYGITANCVCPGYTATERLNELAESLASKSGATPQQVMDGFASSTAAKRVGRPDELAALIAFLAGERAAYITGASIPVDGGSHKGLL
jgi:3-oxoacyl-[acyl-carrier protein] reductase